MFGRYQNLGPLWDCNFFSMFMPLCPFICAAIFYGWVGFCLNQSDPKQGSAVNMASAAIHYHGMSSCIFAEIILDLSSYN